MDAFLWLENGERQWTLSRPRIVASWALCTILDVGSINLMHIILSLLLYFQLYFFNRSLNIPKARNICNLLFTCHTFFTCATFFRSIFSCSTAQPKFLPVLSTGPCSIASYLLSFYFNGCQGFIRAFVCSKNIGAALFSHAVLLITGLLHY